jgi:hypothetical protein
MSSGENVLWIVRRRQKLAFGNHYVDDKYFVFRTKLAALQFRKEKNKRAKRFDYIYPERATWGTN